MEQICQEKIAALVRGKIGSEQVVYDAIDSTNNAAKLLAKSGAPHGAAVVARRQSAGKGRLGRSFYSPDATGIYMTIILRPTFGAEAALLLTSLAAVAVARAIDEVTGVSVKIKWVNDLYFEGKKLCGILAESALRTDGGLHYIVLGIGVNLSTDSFPPALAEIATSLSAANGGAEIDGNRLIAAILNHFDVLYDTMESREFLAEYRARSCVLGKTVSLVQGDSVREVFVRDIDSNGHLLVETPEGEHLEIGTGEMSLKGDWR